MKINFIIDNIGYIGILSTITIIFIVFYERNNNESYKADEKIIKENDLMKKMGA